MGRLGNMRRIEITGAQLRDALNTLLGIEIASGEDLRVAIPAGGGYDNDVVLVVYVEPGQTTKEDSE